VRPTGQDEIRSDRLSLPQLGHGGIDFSGGIVQGVGGAGRRRHRNPHVGSIGVKLLVHNSANRYRTAAADISSQNLNAPLGWLWPRVAPSLTRHGASQRSGRRPCFSILHPVCPNGLPSPPSNEMTAQHSSLIAMETVLKPSQPRTCAYPAAQISRRNHPPWIL